MGDEQGRVTLLFTDIEGSTKLLHRLGDAYAEVLSTHHRLLRDAWTSHRGAEVDTQGDAFFVVFESAADAVSAAVAAQRALAGHEWSFGGEVRVRMGMHTGTPLLVDDNYIGIDVHLAARICSAGHGGQIVLSAATAEAVSPLGPLELVDLGTHRLKDIESPQRLFRIAGEGLATEFPPLKSLGTPSNLPTQATPMIGREAERAQLRAVLIDDDVRLVTLTGPGGIGKTRLSLAVAEDVRADFSDGVYFVALAPLDDPRLVDAAVAAVLGIEDSEAPLSAIAEHLAGRRVLFVFDNFEHVMDAADVVGAVVEAGARAIVSSREPLHLRAEVEYEVPPLSAPPANASAQAALESDAVRLFVARATAVRRGFVLDDANAGHVIEICQRLDGLPLAIELAASRVKLLPPAALLERLDQHLSTLAGPRDAPDRQRTLRGAIDWSYQLLSADEQAAFRRIAVFRGGFTLEAFMHVVDPSGELGDPFELVSSLVDRSLVRAFDDDEQVRFSMLRTLRAYAADRLEVDAGRREVLQRHAAHFARLAEELALGGADQGRLLEDLELEHDNIRVTLERASAGEIDDQQLLVRLAGAAGRFWYRRGHLREGARWLEAAVGSAPADTPPELLARALYNLGIMRTEQRDHGAAREVLERALELYRSVGDERGAASVMNSLGIVHYSLAEYAPSIALLEESIAIKRRIADERALATSLTNLASSVHYEGDSERAIELLERALDIDRRHRNTWGIAVDLNNLAGLLIERGDLDTGERYAFEALALFEDEGDRDGLASSLAELGHVASARGDAQRGARLAAAAIAVWEQVGSPPVDVERQRFDASIERTRAALGEAFEAAWSEGSRMTPEQAAAYARGEASELALL